MKMYGNRPLLIRTTRPLESLVRDAINFRRERIALGGRCQRMRFDRQRPAR
jgi:hypothetical protein